MLRRRSLLAAAPALLAPRLGRAEPSAGLVAAAKREGAVAFYTSIDVAVAEKLAAAFNTHYPDITLRVERSGAERILQRVMQEAASDIHAADVIESSDVTSFIDWKQRGWLAQYVPEDVAKLWPAEERDPDGRFAAVRAHLAVVGYNTRQVKAEDAPRSYADLLQPKWRGRMVKAHPSYSGTIVVATYEMALTLGWEYFDKLAKQRVLQVQSSTEPPKKVVQGERSVMVDGNEYNAFFLREAGEPIEIVYPSEGTPLVSGQAGVFEKAPHPNAARLFADYLFSAECQQLMSDVGGLRSFHPAVKLKPGRRTLAEIKLLRPDPVKLAAAVEDVKKRYAAAFGV